jgi:geranylgeranylglycerol-phosphate geranylgeranyltransferase
MYGDSARRRPRSTSTPATLSVGRVLRGMWQASRPHNAATAAISTTLGTWLSYASARHDAFAFGFTDLRWLWGAPMCALFAVAAANLYNDACDLVADRVNAPHRPIPQGLITERQAVVAAVGCAVLAVLCATQLQGSARWVALVAIVAGLVYSPVLKSTVLVGNAWVAVLSALTIAVGALQVGPMTSVVWMALVSLTLFVLAREILKCMADRVGDAQARLTSVATRFGERGASWIMLAVTVLCGLSLTAPLYGWHEQPRSAGLFAMLALAGGVLPLAAAWYLSAWASPSASSAPRYKAALRLTKAGGLMLLGAFGLLVA